MQHEHALPEDRSEAEARQRRQWTIAAVTVAVFLVALFLGMWVGGDIFAG